MTLEKQINVEDVMDEAEKIIGCESLDPFIKKVFLKLTAPSLNDNTADVDRLIKALSQEKKIRHIQLASFNFGEISETIRKSDFKVTAVLLRNRWQNELIAIEPGDTSNDNFGIGVDIGSTRLAFYLLNLSTGKLLAKKSVDNPQVIHGEDILMRINFARSEKGKETLKRQIIDCCNETILGITREYGISPDNIYSWAFAGNTTMVHFFLGLNSQNICREPYIPVINRIPVIPCSKLGLKTNPDGRSYFFPNVGSYFGGDLLSGILVTGMHRKEEVSLLVDVGTNAEVVIGNKDWLIACAGAAGPALEGGVVQMGMMAKAGAIDKVRINRRTLEPTYTVIGNVMPRGICGSGLIDLVAEMFEAEILDIQGKINIDANSKRIQIVEDVPAYILVFAKDSATGKNIVISEIDIKILLKSKAAMFTILTIVTRKVGLELGDIKRFFIAGTFGNHIDPAKAITIGMLPDLPIDTFIPMGNTAGEGTAQVLLCSNLMEEVEEICNKITYIELNVNAELMAEFRGALFLPHTNRELFPSVKAGLGNKKAVRE